MPTGPATRVISFRVAAEVHDLITRRADAAGLSTRIWLEQAILGDRTQIVARHRPTRDYKALLFQVNRAAHHLGEVADHLQAVATEGTLEKASYLHALDTLAAIEAALTDALFHARAD